MLPLALIGAAALATATLLPGAETHPAEYVDEGACPFECCTYGKWRVDTGTVLLAAPTRDARAVARIGAGSSIDAVGGKVITKAGRFVVKRDHDKYHRGDVLWVYTYRGEGFFRVWHAGRMHEEQLEFDPSGGTAGDRCQDSEKLCWGELDRPLRTKWWVRLRTDHGSEGWTDHPEHFSGGDACG
jgi:hypothetical protein